MGGSSCDGLLANDSNHARLAPPFTRKFLPPLGGANLWARPHSTSHLSINLPCVLPQHRRGVRSTCPGPALRHYGLAGTQLADATVGTIRTRLFKAGALIRVSVRRVLIRFSTGWPMRDVLCQVAGNLAERFG